MRKKERFVLGKRTFRSQKSKHFVLRIIYDGSSNVNWTAVYKVIGNGKFEYVEDSMKKVE